MKTLNFKTFKKTISGDRLTPIQIYLTLRDHYPKCALFESANFNEEEGKYSHILCNPLVEVKVENRNFIVITPEGREERQIQNTEEFARYFEEVKANIICSESSEFTGFYGHTNFEAVDLFDEFNLNPSQQKEIPTLHYFFHKYHFCFNHINNTIELIVNDVEEKQEDLEQLVSKLIHQSQRSTPFKIEGEITSNLTDEEFKTNVTRAKQECQRGNVFQLVLSREFQFNFKGDELNLYRELRAINPSPFMFFCDFGNYKIFGSSPESQLKVSNNQAHLNPIAGTIAKTDPNRKHLIFDEKENAEHVMLVDLARNDLSKHGTDTMVTQFKSIKSFSHLDHIVSTVSCELLENTKSLQVFTDTFPAGTLSGAPKHRAIQLIAEIENQARGIYGGAIGFIGLNNALNHAIIIRSFLSKNNQLFLQAGAGIVYDSKEENELQEINNKLAALMQAIQQAQN